jgi:hypothetical protein
MSAAETLKGCEGSFERARVALTALRDRLAVARDARAEAVRLQSVALADAALSPAGLEVFSPKATAAQKAALEVDALEGAVALQEARCREEAAATLNAQAAAETERLDALAASVPTLLEVVEERLVALALAWAPVCDAGKDFSRVGHKVGNTIIRHFIAEVGTGSLRRALGERHNVRLEVARTPMPTLAASPIEGEADES